MALASASHPLSVWYTEIPMQRFLLILLLVVVPFQFSWAGAEGYCQHEDGKVTLHFGHHSHADRESGDPVKLPSGDSADSGLHHPLFKAGFAYEITLPALTSFVPFDDPDNHFTSFIPSAPERPDRGSPA